MMSQLKRAWKRDRLGVLAVCCAIIAVALVVFPDDVRSQRTSFVVELLRPAKG